MKGEANWLRVFENRVLREILGTGREQVKGLEVNCVVRSGIICAAHPVVRGWSSGQMNGDEMGWAGRVARSWGGRYIKCLVGEIDKWWAIVNAVMNVRIAQNAGNILTG